MIDILNTEHEAYYKKHLKNKEERPLSIIEEVFGGYYLNTILCLECNNVSRTKDPMLDMSVTISFK